MQLVPHQMPAETDVHVYEIYGEVDRQEIWAAYCSSPHDKHLKDRVIEANVGLAKSIILKRYFWLSKDEQEDATQWGIIGLIKALKKFDPSKGTKYSTYATYWAYREISRFAYSLDIIRLPVYLLDRLIRIDRVIQKVLAKTGEMPDDAEIARMTGISLSTLKNDREAFLTRRAESLDAPLGSDEDDSDPYTLGTFLAAQEYNERDQEDFSNSGIFMNGDEMTPSQFVWMIIETLPPDEAIVVKSRLHDMEYSEICQYLEIDLQRAHQLHFMAVQKMKTKLKRYRKLSIKQEALSF